MNITYFTSTANIQTLMENIQIAEKPLPEIADRIWPAAEYLAHFILMFVKNQGCIDSMSITSTTINSSTSSATSTHNEEKDDDDARVSQTTNTTITTTKQSTLPPLNEKSKIARQHVLDSLRNIIHHEIKMRSNDSYVPTSIN